MIRAALTPRVATALLIFFLFGLEFLLRLPALLGMVALYQRDLLLLYFPLVQSALRGLSEGALPLRDATSGFGQPLLADPSCQILYPPVLIHFFLAPHLAYAWFVSLHSIFGATGVAMLAKRISGGAWLAAFVGGAAWLLCGPLQSLATLWHHMAGAAWIPWVLLWVIRVAEGETGAATRLGGVFGLQILAGSADMCAMTLLLSALFVPLKQYIHAARAWLHSALIALALSAGAWLPAMELVRNSARSALSESTRTFWSLHPLSALEFFLPVPLSAFPLLPGWREVLFEGREPFLGSMFMGALILPLGLAALGDARIPRHHRLACFLGALGAFLISLGKNGPAYSIAVALLPPLQILRFPSKGMIPLAVLLCVLAGAGVASVRRSERARRWAAAAALLLGIGAAALLGPLLSTFVGALMDQGQGAEMRRVWENLPVDLVFTLAFLGGFAFFLRWPEGRRAGVLGGALLLGHTLQSTHLNADLNPMIATRILASRPEHLDLLRPPPGGRLYVYDYILFGGRARAYLNRATFGKLEGVEGLSQDAANLVATRAYLAPLTGAFWGIDYGWDADVRLLFEHRLAALTADLRRVEGTPGLLKLLQISGVSRVAALHEAGMDGLKLMHRRKIFFPEDLLVFEVPEVLPRAFLTSGRRPGTGLDLKDLLDRRFDHRTTVLTDGGPVREPVPDFLGRATILERRSDRLVVETSASHPAFLGVIEGAMPGWRARVDGVASKVERANAVFVGTEVPKGTHRVEFRFLPATAVVGVSVSALTALCLLSLFMRRRRSTDRAAEGMLDGTGQLAPIRR